MESEFREFTYSNWNNLWKIFRFQEGHSTDMNSTTDWSN